MRGAVLRVPNSQRWLAVAQPGAYMLTALRAAVFARLRRARNVARGERAIASHLWNSELSVPHPARGARPENANDVEFEQIPDSDFG